MKYGFRVQHGMTTHAILRHFDKLSTGRLGAG